MRDLASPAPQEGQVVVIMKGPRAIEAWPVPPHVRQDTGG